MENCPYSHPQAISNAYNIINKTGKFWESIKYWNCLPLIQKTWIAFKTNLREAHLELTKTVELTLGESGYGKANLVEDIVSRLSAEFQYQANMVNGTPPKDPAPPITGTIELLQQVLVHNQELMRLISDKYGKSVRKNTNRPPTPFTGPCQFPHILINISGNMGMAVTRMAIANPRHLYKRKRTQRRSGWVVSTMDA